MGKTKERKNVIYFSRSLKISFGALLNQHMHGLRIAIKKKKKKKPDSALFSSLGVILVFIHKYYVIKVISLSLYNINTKRTLYLILLYFILLNFMAWTDK